jgi:hypothetical protein
MSELNPRYRVGLHTVGGTPHRLPTVRLKITGTGTQLIRMSMMLLVHFLERNGWTLENVTVAGSLHHWGPIRWVDFKIPHLPPDNSDVTIIGDGTFHGNTYFFGDPGTPSLG